MFSSGLGPEMPTTKEALHSRTLGRLRTNPPSLLDESGFHTRLHKTSPPCCACLYQVSGRRLKYT